MDQALAGVGGQMAEAKGAKTVRESLQSYADRGVFRGFSEVESGARFTFTWLTRRSMDFRLDRERGVLHFKDLLPNIPARSALYGELKAFVEERHGRELPEHRRIDRRRAEAACSNRRGRVSISLQVKRGAYAYGVNRIVNLVHEIFLHLHDAYPEYLAENFDLPQE